MKNDSQELARVAAAAPRFDMYGGIHKALRALMADTLLAVGRMDVADDLDLAQVTQRVLELLNFCSSHLKHENEFVHTAIEARAEGGSDVIAHEHGEHLQHIAHLSQLVAQLRRCDVVQRVALANTLYRELALFTAGNFVHMNVEETAHNALLWARYSDAELVEIHDRLVASIPPEEMMFTARWLVPYLSPVERAGLLADMRAKAPAPAFQAILDTVQPHLTLIEWAKLCRSLGMSAVQS